MFGTYQIIGVMTLQSASRQAALDAATVAIRKGLGCGSIRAVEADCDNVTYRLPVSFFIEAPILEMAISVVSKALPTVTVLPHRCKAVYWEPRAAQ